MELLDHVPAQPLVLSAGRCLLFAYGQLQPGRREPRSASRAWPDRVHGELFDLGSHPAAVHIGQSPGWLRGFVLELDEAELFGDLDAYEEVDRGLYRRVRTKTEAGFDVWVYEFARPIPATAAGPMERWSPGAL